MDCLERGFLPLTIKILISTKSPAASPLRSGKQQAGLTIHTMFAVGSSGIADSSWAEDAKMMNAKSAGGENV